MKIKYAGIFTLILHLNIASYAQTGLVSAGGNFTGAAGTVSFSTGQVDYLWCNGTSGILEEGLQHPLEFSGASVMETASLPIEVYAGPNPAVSDLFLFMESPVLPGFRFAIHNMNGQTILSRRVNNRITTIPVSSWAPGTYLLEIKLNGALIRTFNILKP